MNLGSLDIIFVCTNNINKCADHPSHHLWLDLLQRHVWVVGSWGNLSHTLRDLFRVSMWQVLMHRAQPNSKWCKKNSWYNSATLHIMLLKGFNLVFNGTIIYLYFTFPPLYASHIIAEYTWWFGFWGAFPVDSSTVLSMTAYSNTMKYYWLWEFCNSL